MGPHFPSRWFFFRRSFYDLHQRVIITNLNIIGISFISSCLSLQKSLETQFVFDSKRFFFFFCLFFAPINKQNRFRFDLQFHMHQQETRETMESKKNPVFIGNPFMTQSVHVIYISLNEIVLPLRQWIGDCQGRDVGGNANSWKFSSFIIIRSEGKNKCWNIKSWLDLWFRR